ncbi:MAG: hypothetical protein R3B52_00270 [Candidatus Paceibacterota bacterium]
MAKSKWTLVLALFLTFLAGRALAATVSVSVTVAVFECSDGSDNDADGFTDYPSDADCDSATDDSEAPPLSLCEDGIDNDGDGLTDYPADPGCESSSDDSEVNATQESTGAVSGSYGGTGSSQVAQPGQNIPSDANSSVEFSGQTLPNATVTILRNGLIVATAQADEAGSFQIIVASQPLGIYTYTINASTGNLRSLNQSFPVENSQSSQAVISDVDASKMTSQTRGDLNSDNRVNLKDFSILVYWMNRLDFPETIRQAELGILSGDGRITLRDFSILAYYWTG